LIKRPINYIFLEGPDLSGKTTFYEKMHKATNYRWNIHDRSSLSMLVHAKQYERNTFRHVEQLRSELYNLNNIMIILLPDWDEIAKRFNSRGDPIQNITSLRKIYSMFSDAVSEFENYSNVIVLRKPVDDQTIKYIINLLKEYENPTTKHIQKNFLNSIGTKKENECIGMNVTLFDEGDFSDIDEGDLLYEEEVDYYNDIITETIDKIKKELAGENDHNKKQTFQSRRFIYTSNTCISLGHFLLREEGLDCKFFLRSSNVKDTLYYDLNFIKYFSSQVYSLLKANGKFCRINVVINSGHVIPEEEL